LDKLNIYLLFFSSNKKKFFEKVNFSKAIYFQEYSKYRPPLDLFLYILKSAIATTSVNPRMLPTIHKNKISSLCFFSAEATLLKMSTVPRVTFSRISVKGEEAIID